MRSRTELRGRLIDAFAGRDEVAGLYAFGREVDGAVDEYSDIDLIVCSGDLAATQRHFLPLLSSIAPIAGAYYIRCDPSELAVMVMLDGFSPYQKIDLGIVPAIDAKAEFAPFNRLHASAGIGSPNATAFTFDGERQALGNRLNDLLFSIPRFTKCLFRGDWDMYRRWTGLVESTTVMLYERYFGWGREHRNRLSAHEYKALHKALSASDRGLLARVQPLDGRPDIVDGFVEMIDVAIRLYADKATALGQRIDAPFAQRMQEFLAGEVQRFRKP